MANFNSNVDREIEEGLARADKMLRQQRFTQSIIVIIGLAILSVTFFMGRWTSSIWPSLSSDNFTNPPTHTLTPTFLPDTLTPITTSTPISTETPSQISIKSTLAAEGTKTAAVQKSATKQKREITIANETMYVSTTLTAMANEYGKMVVSKPVVISAKSAWYDTQIKVKVNDWVVMQYVSGTWSVDSNGFSNVDGNGYISETPAKWCIGCSAPIVNGTLGKLVFRIGTQTGGTGNSKTFQTRESGQLLMMINDAYAALQDNAGAITVNITIYRRD